VAGRTLRPNWFAHRRAVPPNRPKTSFQAELDVRGPQELTTPSSPHKGGRASPFRMIERIKELAPELQPDAPRRAKCSFEHQVLIVPDGYRPAPRCRKRPAGSREATGCEEPLNVLSPGSSDYKSIGLTSSQSMPSGSRNAGWSTGNPTGNSRAVHRPPIK
jgi:hypothetical protein